VQVANKLGMPRNKLMIHERRKHTLTILTSCIASRTDLAGAKFGANIASASLELEGYSAPLKRDICSD
jgi:hypothetical protein